MGAPVLVGAGIGAVTSLAMGKDPLMGAAMGGLSGGAFGGAEGFGSGFTEGGLFSLGSQAGGGVATGLANAPTMGGLELAGAASGTAASAPVAGATASPYAFGGNAIEATREATVPSLLTGEAGGAIQPNILDTFTDKITPSGGYVADADKGLLDKAYDSVASMSPLEQAQLGMIALESTTPQEQAQQMMQGGGQIKPSKEVTVGTPLAINVPSTTFKRRFA